MLQSLASLPHSPLVAEPLAHGLLKLLMHEMARLYRPYNAPPGPASAINVTLDESHVTLAIPHRVADVTQTILWRIARQAHFTANTVPLQVAFQAPPGHPQTWHTGTLTLTSSLELRD